MTKKKEKIGRYSILKTIGKGGMGEVLLAFDPICQRKIAIKKIRNDLLKKAIIKKRFLKEAKIASRLTHPCIVPIYAIDQTDEYVYYTMPYVEGQTLKDIISKASKSLSFSNEKGSIAQLIRIFLSICEAVAYTHSKNILHRDLKPTNVIVGKYGEVLILDWGIADFIDKAKIDDDFVENTIDIKKDEKKEITRPGKLAGTVTFMAPERAFGEKASIQTEIYSLGVILYQMLTLTIPFARKNIAEFRKYAKKEILADPIAKAPYRDIPEDLSEICKKCLSKEKEKRYQSVNSLIKDIQNHIEGKAKWILDEKIDITNKKYLAICENIFLPKHTVISNSLESSEWMRLLLAKKNISKNLKLKTKIFIKDSSEGIGFLLSIPNLDPKYAIEDGYILWIGKNKTPLVQLIRSNALVMEKKEIPLLLNDWNDIEIIKEENSLLFFLNQKQIFTYKTQIPLAGSHIGIIHKDFNCDLKEIEIYSKSHSVMINCLAIGDTFFAKKDFDSAYNEYIAVSESFPGRMEGLLALFRAGVTILKKAEIYKDRALFSKALDEFEKLQKTFAAPLEYLGKSLVYADLQEFDEEAKCLELAIRKYKNHPLLPMIYEHVLYRIYESSLKNREPTYRLLLLSLLHIKDIAENPETKKFIDTLNKNWEKVYFITPSKNSFIIELAYRLSKTNTLKEIYSKLLNEKHQNEIDIQNVLFALLDLNSLDILNNAFEEKFPKIHLLSEISKSVTNNEQKLKEKIKNLFDLFPKKLEQSDINCLIFLIKFLIDHKFFNILEKQIFKMLKKHVLDKDNKILFDAYEIWTYLYQNNLTSAKKIFDTFQMKDIEDENNLLNFLFGIYTYKSNGKEKALQFLAKVLDTSYPKTSALLSFFLTKKMEKWFLIAFFFEKRELYRQLSLFYKCINDQNKEKHFSELALQKE